MGLSFTESLTSFSFRFDRRREPVVYDLPKKLQANNYNVEIFVDGTLEESVDTMSLKLLSTRRHFEELEEYRAPSIES